MSILCWTMSCSLFSLIAFSTPISKMLWMELIRLTWTVSSCLVNTGTLVLRYLAFPTRNFISSKSLPNTFTPNFTRRGDFITEIW